MTLDSRSMLPANDQNLAMPGRLWTADRPRAATSTLTNRETNHDGNTRSVLPAPAGSDASTVQNRVRERERERETARVSSSQPPALPKLEDSGLGGEEIKRGRRVLRSSFLAPCCFQAHVHCSRRQHLHHTSFFFAIATVPLIPRRPLFSPSNSHFGWLVLWGRE